MTELPKKTKANKKDAQLLIRISSAERDEFIHLCECLDTSAARELRKFGGVSKSMLTLNEAIIDEKKG